MAITSRAAIVAIGAAIALPVLAACGSGPAPVASPTTVAAVSAIDDHSAHTGVLGVVSGSLMPEAYAVQVRLAILAGTPMPCDAGCSFDSDPQLLWGQILVRCEKVPDRGFSEQTRRL